MSRRVLLLVFAGLAIVGTAFAGAQGRPAEPADDLAAEVRSLRERVETLEKRLRSLETDTKGVIIQPDSFEGRPLSPPAGLPRGAKQRQFNGMSYYIIPVEAGAVDLRMPAHEHDVPPQR